MKLRTTTSLSLAGTACGLAFVFAFPPFTAMADDPPEVWSETYEIERQVDPARYVRLAVMSNNVHGDFVLEFTADRTDVPDTRERWTLIFANDPNFIHVSRLEVNGVWIYSSGLYEENDTVMAMLSTPTASVEVDVQDPCGSNLSAYEALRVETAAYSAVVAEVLDAMPTSQAQPQPSWFTCYQQECEPMMPPSICNQSPPPGDCTQEYSCCVLAADFHLCADLCRCKSKPVAERRKCEQDAKATHKRKMEKCKRILDYCFPFVPC